MFYIRSMPLKAYRSRCYPTATQAELLKQFFGAKRFVWNRCLAWRSNLYDVFGESVTGVDFSRELTWLKKLETYQWLKQVPATVLVQALRDQDKAFQQFFKEPSVGYPRFKSRHHGQAIRFQLDQRVVMNHYRAGELLKLPGLGPIKIKWSRVPNGVPKMVTITKDPAGRYFVSMGIEEEIPAKVSAGSAVGIDLGTLTSMTLSNGWQVANPRHLAKRKAQMKRLQQRLARQKKGSNRRSQTQRRIARLHARIADCRREYLHQVTSRIVDENQIIVIEDLNVKGMTASSAGDRENPGKNVRQKAGLNRSILDVSFGEIVRQLEYKSAWYGRTLLKVDRFFPSSKTCSCCGHKVDELRLDVRSWTCPKCGTEHDRDINAAINILNEGLKQLGHADSLSAATFPPSVAVTPGGAGEVRDFGGEGASPTAVSPRSSDQPNACLELA